MQGAFNLLLINISFKWSLSNKLTHFLFFSLCAIISQICFSNKNCTFDIFIIKKQRQGKKLTGEKKKQKCV
jgi:hypothetical protein